MSQDDPRVTVLFTVDSLRADALDAADVPTMDRLGEHGTVFENAFAHGNWTPFSFPSVLGSDHVFADSRGVGVSDAPTLATRLQEAGVETAGFNAANGFLTEHWGYDDGFDAFETFTGSNDGFYSRYLTAHPTVQAWVQVATTPVRRLVGRGESDATNVSRMRDVERRAIEFLDDAEPPFFLWVHYMDTHTPYVPAPKYVRDVTGDSVGSLRMLRAHLRAGLGREVGDGTLADLESLYRATVQQVDDSVERVLSALDDRGLRDDATVVLAGDHGEEFMEHGHLAHYPKLYEELVHVPFVVDAPDAEPRRVEQAVGLDAVPATICDAMGVPTDGLVGESLLPTVRDGEAPPDEPVTSVAVRGERVTSQPIPRHLDDGELLVSARTADWAYVYHTDSGDRELYDRTRDPTEQDDRWAEKADSDVVRRLHDAVERRLDSIGSAAEGEDATDAAGPPSGVTDQLKALGYQ
ncbi:MAG TPA: sulfatase-like hydrolase/transferase [Natronoarchaeum rubrum]|nr:sulfatase-like hydrolase/transferase [Natronoarchaeum rubrum]